ncbi:hypothetical protein, partial [Blautia sp.]|uniref:hypothetical protein n=1 Tax=Blautia sp. TaxID=1955243 RepID=UPI00261DD5A7
SLGVFSALKPHKCLKIRLFLLQKNFSKFFFYDIIIVLVVLSFEEGFYGIFFKKDNFKRQNLSCDL